MNAYPQENSDWRCSLNLPSLVLVMLLVFTLLLGVFLVSTAEASPKDVGVDYDIIYVRYPPKDATDDYVTIPQGEHPYDIAPGADLMLLKPDGSETILVDCVTCSVMDPYISYDARYVYYSLIEEPTRESASWIYKIDLTNKNYTPIRLTFDDGFDSLKYAGNDTSEHDQASLRSIRDMAPVPLSDGRLLFTSNRAGLTAFDPGTNAVVRESIQQLYVMDDHDGSKTTAALSNLRQLETGSLHMVQHPIQLMDGRILFSTWQDVGNKFRYAMTSLFTVHPDGSNMQQFTEPHDHHKNVEHFVTQLADEQVVSGWYYPSFDYGFGALLRFPISDPSGIDFLRQSIPDLQPFNNARLSFREFDRKETKNLTPHTWPGDSPAPNRSGKYAMPSATKNGDLLVAYSTGYVNWFDAVCAAKDRCEALKSGIYIIRDAGTSQVDSPDELVKVLDSPDYNEIWPRAVLKYEQIYAKNNSESGPQKPALIPGLDIETDTPYLIEGEAAAIIGTSSMYNMDPSDRNDVFQSNYSREHHDGNWTIQGAEAGVFTNEDIYAVRIMATPPKPFTKPIRKWWGDGVRHRQLTKYLNDARLDDIVARYGSFHNERWEILGEFPLAHKATTDKQGNPDSSWMAKIPSDTPFLIQTLDKNGMTIVSELTWRALKSGEERTDCGGCHAHSIEALDFYTTQAGKRAAIRNVPGVSNDDVRVRNGMWDLTSGSIPTLTSTGVTFIPQRSLDVEFNRDVIPILNQHCASCHTAAKPNSENGGLHLDSDPWGALTNKSGYQLPQISKYIRNPQARESLLVWVAWGQRLDGRTNGSRVDDVDYPNNHPALNLTDLEKRTIARWVDMGGPINFPQTDGFGYTDDNQLPVINVFTPKRGYNNPNNLESWKIGVIDAKSGINYSTFKVNYSPISDKGLRAPAVTADVDIQTVRDNSGVLQISAPTAPPYILEVSVEDNAGNLAVERVYVHKVAPPPGRIPFVEVN